MPPDNHAHVRVKFISRVQTRTWLRQFPGLKPVWNNCEFIFDLDARDYDWLVVYDDMPPDGRERFSGRCEALSCPPQHTLLVTGEPSSIKTYGDAFTRQFGHVLTSHVDWALPHPDRIWSQPALQWFYGLGSNHEVSYDTLHDTPPWEKTREVSTVCSIKQQTHTLHNRRYRFTQALKTLLPGMDIYGHGVQEMDDKAEALHDYRYHVAIENYRGPHHWTEKLADPFLGLALPFYYGCTNAADYFPEQSFIQIDMDDVEATAAIIEAAIRDNEYEKRLPAIVEARRRVLEEYNLFAVLSRIIDQQHQARPVSSGHGMLYSRRAINRFPPVNALKYLYQKGRNRLLHRIRSL
ncbi:MAG: glycosyltransferase family 10 [Gammaproteobacteria bacterium]|nr:glycosyltransferase family 10 [Gammaproteobacteria bacterium]